MNRIAPHRHRHRHRTRDPPTKERTASFPSPAIVVYWYTPRAQIGTSSTRVFLAGSWHITPRPDILPNLNSPLPPPTPARRCGMGGRIDGPYSTARRRTPLQNRVEQSGEQHRTDDGTMGDGTTGGSAGSSTDTIPDTREIHPHHTQQETSSKCLVHGIRSSQAQSNPLARSIVTTRHRKSRATASCTGSGPVKPSRTHSARSSSKQFMPCHHPAPTNSTLLCNAIPCQCVFAHFHRALCTYPST